MEHVYKISGMHCGACKEKIETVLNAIEAVVDANVALSDDTVTVEMTAHVTLEALQQALLDADPSYRIYLPAKTGECHESAASKPIVNGTGIYYCPMHCEGEKTYTQPTNCPICGMDLLEQPSLLSSASYTCPMHPEVIEDKSGDCRICGMDLVAR